MVKLPESAVSFDGSLSTTSCSGVDAVPTRYMLFPEPRMDTLTIRSDCRFAEASGCFYGRFLFAFRIMSTHSLLKSFPVGYGRILKHKESLVSVIRAVEIINL